MFYTSTMPSPEANPAQRRIIGRYEVYGVMASGGMATVHYGRLTGPAGFSRPVAVKRMHAQFAANPEFVKMFLDEARMASRVRHTNVVALLDLVTTADDIFLVMEYVQGDSLSRMLRWSAGKGELIPVRLAATILGDALRGLHAAHEAKDEQGREMRLVHRDVSPQNILVGSDGVSRVLDFGVAKATNRLQTTAQGEVKGKVSYMAPEQLCGGEVDRRSDIFSAAIVLWEALTGRRMAEATNPGASILKIIQGDIERPSQFRPDIPEALDDIVVRGLQKEPEKRFQTAKEMASAIERAVGVAGPTEIGEWVESLAGAMLSERSLVFAEIESQVTNRTELNHREEGAALAASLGTHATPSQTPELLSSQVSTISVSLASKPQMPSRSGRRAVFASLAVSGALVVGGLALILLPLKRSSSGVPPIDSAPMPPPEQSAGAQSAIPSDSVPPPNAAPAPSREGLVAGESPARSATPPKPASVAKPPPGKQNCTPPYTIDDRGHKVWKRNCL